MTKRPIYYSQLDPRWKSIRYAIGASKSTIGTSGCGPTSAAMVVAQFLDKLITPKEMAAWSVEHGYRTANDGTYRSLFAGVAKAWGLAFKESYSFTEAQKCLDAGGLVACHVRAGRWTSGGHFIVWWGYGDGKVHINDPSGDTAYRNTGSYAELQACCGAYLCFWPPKPVEPEKPKEEKKLTEKEVIALFEKLTAEREAGRTYRTLKDVPDWGREVVEKLTGMPRKDDPTKMVLEGDQNQELNITLDMLRVLVVNDRAGLYN